MTTRIALTLAGGVSLGAYQAGAVYELLWALAHRADPREPIVIDVLTGASAGAMTAAVLARALLYDRAVAEELHRAWVTDISAADLLAGQPTASLFSDQPVQELARRILEAPPAPTNPHPAAPRDLRMAFALSNLNGINYSLGYANVPGGFDTTVFSDWIIFRLGGDAPVDPPLLDVWRSIARAGVASGAFPFAFPTVELERRLADYHRSEIYHPTGTRGFTYVDGGLFNNEPVGLAREIVEGLEEDYPGIEMDRRLHILVDPYVDSNVSLPHFPEDPLSYRLLVGRLIGAIMGEASKRDWVRASRVNTRLKWQDDLLRYLAEIVAEIPTTDREAFAARVGQLAHRVAAFKVAYQTAGREHTDAAVRRHLEANIRRLGPMLCGDHEAYARIRSDRLHTEAFLTIVYILENVAGLRKKVDLDLHLIAPARGSLAGDFFFNFGGFFVEAWREHDWRRGRADARAVLGQLSREHPGLAYTPDAPAAYVPERDLSEVSGEEIPPQAKDALRRRIADEVTRLILPKPVWYLPRWLVSPIVGRVADRVVGNLLKRAS